jgi:hypothetical protein
VKRAIGKRSRCCTARPVIEAMDHGVDAGVHFIHARQRRIGELGGTYLLPAHQLSESHCIMTSVVFEFHGIRSF